MQGGLTEAWKKRASFSSGCRGRVRSGWHFFAGWANNGHLGAKQRLKLISCSCHQTFYPHHTKHKEVVAYSTNNGGGPTQRKYNETHLQFWAHYLIANYRMAQKNTKPETRDLEAIQNPRFQYFPMLCVFYTGPSNIISDQLTSIFPDFL